MFMYRIQRLPALRSSLHTFSPFVLAAICATATADPVSWIAGDGAWETAGNWSTGELPSADDFVDIPTTGILSASAGDNTAREVLSLGMLAILSGKLDVIGTIDTSGTVALSGGGLIGAGRIEVGETGAFTLDDALSAADVVEGVFNRGVLAVRGGARLGAESFDNFAQWQVESAGTAAANSMINHGAATLALTGADSTLTVSGNLTNDGAVVVEQLGSLATWSLDNFASVLVTNGGAYSTETVINDGRIEVVGAGATWTASDVVTNHGEIDIGPQGSASIATLDNEASAVITAATVDTVVATNHANASLALVDGAALTVGELALNAGTLHIDATSVLMSGSFQQTAGSTVIDGGTLGATFPDGVAFVGGALRGSGTLDANLFVGGNAVIAPGLIPGAIGHFDILGDLLLTGGELLLDLASTAPGDFDRLAVSGDIFLGGTLRIALGGGIALAVGDYFVVLTGDTVNGLFDAIFLPALGGNLVFQVINGDDYVRVAVAAVPLPAPLLLLFAGCGLLSLVRRRAV